jgi:hypothetical protein
VIPNLPQVKRFARLSGRPLLPIGDELGRGGMGVVYEAEQVSLARSVALKVLPFAALLDKKQLQRFQNEARAAAQLSHPNIVGVHSVGCDRGMHYYSMDLVIGQSLAQVIELLSGVDVADSTTWPSEPSDGDNPDQSTSRSQDCTIRIGDVSGRKLIDSIRGHSGVIHSIAFSPGGNRLESGSNDGAVRLWDVSTSLASVDRFEGHRGGILDIGFSDNSQRRATVSWDGRAARLLDTKTVRSVAEFPGLASAGWRYQ